jgi:hypothetical protein
VYGYITVICWLDMALFIVSEKWNFKSLTSKKALNEDARRVVVAAAKFEHK